MRRVVRIMGCVAALAVAGCGDDDMPIADLSGDWTFADEVTAAFGTCTASGIATLSQTGRTLTGVINATAGECVWDGGGVNDNSGPVDLSSGQVGDSLIVFSAGICDFEGTLVTANRIEGTEVCNVTAIGQTFPMTGPFSLSR